MSCSGMPTSVWVAGSIARSVKGGEVRGIQGKQDKPMLSSSMPTSVWAAKAALHAHSIAGAR